MTMETSFPRVNEEFWDILNRYVTAQITELAKPSGDLAALSALAGDFAQLQTKVGSKPTDMSAGWPPRAEILDFCYKHNVPVIMTIQGFERAAPVAIPNERPYVGQHWSPDRGIEKTRGDGLYVPANGPVSAQPLTPAQVETAEEMAQRIADKFVGVI